MEAPANKFYAKYGIIGPCVALLVGYLTFQRNYRRYFVKATLTFPNNSVALVLQSAIQKRSIPGPILNKVSGRSRTSKLMFTGRRSKQDCPTFIMGS